MQREVEYRNSTIFDLVRPPVVSAPQTELALCDEYVSAIRLVIDSRRAFCDLFSPERPVNLSLPVVTASRSRRKAFRLRNYLLDPAAILNRLGSGYICDVRCRDIAVVHPR
jgi:hypothetical protein